MPDVSLRVAEPRDAPALLHIYEYYVRNTAITYEYEVPTPAEFTRRIRHTLERYPYLVAVSEGEIVGYAYAGAFNERAAYDWTAEASVYLDRDRRHGGLGKRLYTALEEALRRQGVQNLVATVSVPEREDVHLTGNSLGFHEHMGFTLAGVLPRCGYKFGCWYGTAHLNKALGTYPTPAVPVRPFPEIRGDFEAWLREQTASFKG